MTTRVNWAGVASTVFVRRVARLAEVPAAALSSRVRPAVATILARAGGLPLIEGSGHDPARIAEQVLHSAVRHTLAASVPMRTDKRYHLVVAGSKWLTKKVVPLPGRTAANTPEVVGEFETDFKTLIALQTGRTASARLTSALRMITAAVTAVRA